MASKAERLVDHILEAGINPGEYPDWIHPEKHTKIGQRTHPLGNNPAFPQNWQRPQGEKSEHWEALLASEQYQATLRRLNDFINRSRPQGQQRPLGRQDFQTVMQAMFGAVMQAVQMERPHANRLVKMAIDLIFEQPEFSKLREPYQNGEFKIDAKLGPGELGNAILSPEVQGQEGEEETEGGDDPEQVDTPDEVEREANAADQLADITPEIAKRKVINAMIHGGAVSKNYAYQLITQDLQAINPNLTTLYGIAMAGSELGYFATPDAMAAMAKDNPELAGGSSEVEFEEDNVPVVKARGLIFPMLVQELAKGLLELVSYEGLPQDPDMAREVIDKADFVDEESWAMIMGRGLWTRFVAALGGDQDEITMHLYNKIVQMPVDEFNQTMQTIQAGGPEANAVVKRLAQEIRMDMETQDRAEAGFEGGGYGGDEGFQDADPDAWKKG